MRLGPNDLKRLSALLRQQKLIPRLDGDKGMLIGGDGLPVKPPPPDNIGGLTVGPDSITGGSGNGKLRIGSTGLFRMGDYEGGLYAMTLSSGYLGSGGAFKVFYNQKKLIILDAGSDGPGAGALYLYDDKEARGAQISGLGFARFTGPVTSATTINPPVTVAALGTATAGARRCVTDAAAALSANLGEIVQGGGANFSPVYADGTNWRQG